MATNGSIPNAPEPYLDSGLNVVIAGAGVPGMWCALECKRNGLHPTIVDWRSPTSEPDGDFFVIGPSAVRSLQNWPKAMEEFDEYKHNTLMNYFRHDGGHVFGPFPAPEKLGKIFIRKQFQSVLINEMKRQNIPIRYGVKVIDYEETETKGIAILDNGERLEGDVVIAADGVHSRSWKIITGEKVQPSPSGLAILRCSMPAEMAMANPLVNEKFGRRDGHDTLAFLLGQGTHCNVVVNKEFACWLLIHEANEERPKLTWSNVVQDLSTGHASESWAGSLTTSEALKIVQDTPGWDPVFLDLVKSSPNVVDWRLMWRNPQPNWVSPKGRVVQVGDSAHTFLPTSANGATQALEDGSSLAACLRLAGGVKGIPSALKVHNKLRFERVSCAQLFGIVNRQSLQKTKVEVLAKQPDLVKKLMPGEWISNHNPEEYAISRFSECSAALANGTPFVNTNLPGQYTYKPWNINGLFRRMDAGETLVLEGNWT